MLTLTIIMAMLVGMLVFGLLGDVLWSRETPETIEVASAQQPRASFDPNVEMSAKGSGPVDSLAA